MTAYAKIINNTLKIAKISQTGLTTESNGICIGLRVGYIVFGRSTVISAHVQ